MLNNYSLKNHCFLTHLKCLIDLLTSNNLLKELEATSYHDMCYKLKYNWQYATILSFTLHDPSIKHTLQSNQLLTAHINNITIHKPLCSFLLLSRPTSQVCCWYLYCSFLSICKSFCSAKIIENNCSTEIIFTVN